MEKLNFVFTAISAICAVIGVLLTISANNSKKESKQIKEEIINYRAQINEKNDLLLLKSTIEPLKTLSNQFCRISTKRMPELRGKTTLDYYAEHFEQLNKLSFKIPEKYKKVKETLNYLKEGFNTCIENEKTFDKLDNYSRFNYRSMTDNYSKLIDSINTITSELLM